MSDDHLDLTALLRGGLPNAEAILAGDHLRTCEACRDELVDASVGHALLARAVSTLGPDRELPDPQRLAPADLHRLTSRRPPLRLLAAAAALVVAAGAAGAVATALLGRDTTATQVAPQITPQITPEDTPEGTPQPAVTARLSPLPDDPTDPGSSGDVAMVPETDGQVVMTIHVTGLPRTGSGTYYYAWLLDPATNKILPLGQVGPGGPATFDLDDALVSSYSAVDVSLESDDGDPAHSVTSVLRGQYA